MTPSDLRALLAAATPGPWKAGRNGPIAMVVSGYDPDRFPRQFRADCGISDADATLIAAAVNAIGPLLDALDAAEAERDAARAELDRVRAAAEADAETMRGLYDDVEQARDQLAEARADLAETRLRLAIWSGEGVPEGWEAAADGEPYLVRRRGEWAVTLDPAAGGGAVWAGWWRLDECERCEEREYQRTATATEALAAAEAWLAGVAP